MVRAKKFCYIFGYFFFNLVIPSTSICVFENGTYCEDSSVLLVSHSDVKENNGYSILVEQLCILSKWFNCEECCAGNILCPVVVAKIQEINLDSRMIDNGLAEIIISPDIGSGKHTITLEFNYSIRAYCACFPAQEPGCGPMSPGCGEQPAFQLNHTITLKVIDNPTLHQSENPKILQCQLNYQFSDAWSEFVLNDIVLGYCGKFTHPVKDEERGISIYYDSSDDVCSLKIDEFSEDNKGSYSCNVMVPYPDGRGYLRLNSTPIIPQDSNTITEILGVIVGTVSLIIIAIVICICVCRRYQLKARHAKQRMNALPDVQYHNEPG